MRAQQARAWVRAACVAWLGCWSVQATAQSVVFINPGKSDEAYWVGAADAMQKAADSLGMQLQVIYAQRNRLEPLNIARQVAQRPQEQRPRYVIFSNEYSVAPGILKELEGSGIYAFMAFSGVEQEQLEQVGPPRERYPFWLGSLSPRAEDAGYLTAKALIQTAQAKRLQAGGGPLQMLAIAGDRSTPTSIARNRGMHRAVAESQGQVQLLQEVYGEWRQDKAREQAQVLFRRYPAARVVWSGNDLMAFGAMEAWSSQGGKPGQDAIFSGVNTSTPAFQKLRSGELTALAGGHFLAGAWSMVMLFDHAKGIDFVNEGVQLEQPMFKLFDAASSLQFERIFGTSPKPLNFKPFSKHHNPSLRRYDFDLEKLLRQAP